MYIAKKYCNVVCSTHATEYETFFQSSLFDENEKKLNHVSENMHLLFEKWRSWKILFLNKNVS